VIRRPLLAALACLSLAGALPAVAQTVEVAGVKYEPSIPLGGAKLLLNGAGVRYKAVFKVYTAGLYLNAKASTPDAVLANSGPRRMHIVMLRDIDANELGKLFIQGIEQNTSRDEFAQAIPGTLRLGEIFATKKKLVSGEFFSIDWLPGTGTVILVDGKPVGEPIKEPEFFNALMKIWFGKSPADYQLKDALLGTTRSATN
jgi:Chalcone isomerase-like